MGMGLADRQAEIQAESQAKAIEAAALEEARKLAAQTKVQEQMVLRERFQERFSPYFDKLGVREILAQIATKLSRGGELDERPLIFLDFGDEHFKPKKDFIELGVNWSVYSRGSSSTHTAGSGGNMGTRTYETYDGDISRPRRIGVVIWTEEEDHDNPNIFEYFGHPGPEMGFSGYRPKPETVFDSRDYQLGIGGKNILGNSISRPLSQDFPVERIKCERSLVEMCLKGWRSMGLHEEPKF